MTTMVSTAYAFVVWLAMGWSGDSPITLGSFKAIVSVEDSIFFTIFLHLLIYYLVAFISGYLSERINDRDRQLADTSLALKKARLETDDILRHLNSGLLTVDASGKIIFFNRAAERILGFLETDVKGMHCEDVFSERMPQLAEDILLGIHNLKEIPRKELNVITASGDNIPLGFSTSVLTEEKGQLRGIIAIFTDLTKAKSLEAKVRAADRLAAVGELSASIAHEIRNPLAAISGSVQVLKGEIELHGDNERLMSLIIKESDRLTELLNDFLAYSRIDRPVFGKVELIRLISEVIEIVKHHQSYNSRINISCFSDYQSVFVIADEGMVKQLLINLTVNACEAFNNNGGEVKFKLSQTPDAKRAVLEVIDNGPGIEITEIHNIYKPFYSTKSEGTGLGLSIVQRICNILKLPISVETPDNGGTIFKIDFPTENSSQIDSVNESKPQKIHPI